MDSLHEHAVDSARSSLKLSSLLGFLNIGLNHPHIGDVLLDTTIEIIVSLKDLGKEWIDNLKNKG